MHGLSRDTHHLGVFVKVYQCFGGVGIVKHFPCLNCPPDHSQAIILHYLVIFHLTADRVIVISVKIMTQRKIDIIVTIAFIVAIFISITIGQRGMDCTTNNPHFEQEC